jgi:hypothetical protein
MKRSRIYNLGKTKRTKTRTKTRTTNNKMTTESIIAYDEFLNEEDICKFESDMEEGKYKDWVEKFPKHTLSIFGALLTFNGNFLKEEDIVYFMNNGIDLNLPSKAYASEFDSTTILVFACEHRYLELVRHLLGLGVDVDQRDPNQISPLESGLMGHGMNCIYNIEETESLMRILTESNVKKEIRKFILEDYCQEYLKKSEYLSSILNSCKFI